MRLSKRLFVGMAVLSCLAQTPLALAVLIGQLDDFEDGTTQSWAVGDPGHPAPPANVPTGGPGGLADNYLLLTSLGGNGPGSRLSVFNLDQWAGDYIAAGVNAVRMNVNNFGATDLFLRLLFADPFGGPPNNVAFSTEAIFLPASSGWRSVLFPISVADLTVDLGTAAAALMNATEMRIFHNPDPTFPGPGAGIPAIEASLGVDNITAVPEASSSLPLSLGLLVMSLAGIAARARRSSA